MSSAEELGQLAYAVACAYDPNRATEPGVDKHALRAQATSFCDQVRLSPHGWRITLALFLAPGCDTHSKFFALSALQGFLGGGRDPATPILTDARSRQEVREGILGWLQAMNSSVEGEEAFIRTKLAVVLALCLKNDYPESWPSGFAELQAWLVVDGLGSPAWNTELYLRILCAVDEEIVTFHVDRTTEEVAHNCLIKDTMRSTGAVGETCLVVREIVTRYGGIEAQQHLAVLALTTVTSFVAWIDLSHFSEEGFLSLLYDCVRSPALAEAALMCLLEMVNKPNSADSALASADIGLGSAGAGAGAGGASTVVGTLLKLRVLPLVAAAQDVSAADEDTAEAAAAVVNALGVTLLALLDDLEVEEGGGAGGAGITSLDPHVPPPAAGAGAGSQQQQQPQSVVSTVAAMLNEACGYMLRFLSHRCCDVSSTVVPFATRLLDTVKRQQQQQQLQQLPIGGAASGEEGSGGGPAFDGSAVVPQLLNVVFEQLHYSNDFSFADSDDDEAEEEIHRRAIRKVLLKTTRVCPDLSLHFLCSLLTQQSQALSSLPFSRAEALLRVVFHFGEGVGPKRQDDLVAEGNFPAILTALHASDVSSHPHPMVVVLYLETAERYWRQLRASAIASSDVSVVGAVVERMCAGLTAAHSPTLRARSAFLLKSLVKRLGPQLMEPFAPTVLAGIRALLFGGEGSSQQSDLNQLFELASLLLSNLDPSLQAQHLDALVAPVVASMHELLTGGAEQGAAMGERLAQKMSFLAMASKGSTRPQPHLDPSYAHVLLVSTSCLSRLPHLEAVRLKFMVVLHRMVVVLNKETILHALAPILPLLVTAPHRHLLEASGVTATGGGGSGFASSSSSSSSSCEFEDEDVRDVEAVAPLLNQLILYFAADLHRVLDPVLVPFLQRIVALASPAVATTAAASPQSSACGGEVGVGGGASAVSCGGGGVNGAVGSTHVAAVAAGLRRHYLVLLHHVAAHRLSSVLSSPHNRPNLQGVLDVVVAALADHTLDPVLAKTAIATLTALTQDWLSLGAVQATQTSQAPAAVGAPASAAVVSSPAEASQLAAFFASFLLDKVIPVSLAALLAPSFNPKDANSARVVTEVAKLLFTLNTVLPDNALPQSLLAHTLPALNFPPNHAQAFVAAAFAQQQQQQLGGGVVVGSSAQVVEKALRVCLADNR